MKNRMICLFLSVVLCFSLLPSAALASEATATPCYIASSDCPEAYIEYARENISKFVMSITENQPESRFSVGTPFAFAAQDADIYYFPVIGNGRIKYLFRVYPSGDGFGCAISEFLAAELNELAPLTSASSPMYLRLVDDCIVATIGNQPHELFQYPVSMSNASETAVFSTAAGYSVRNVAAISDIALNLQPARDVSNYIPLQIIETQSDNNWCTAYCLAMIVRTQTTYYTTARSLMTQVLGSNPDTETAFPWSSDYGVTMTSILNIYGIYPVVRITTVSETTLMQEIMSGRPCLAAMKTQQTNPNDRYHHSILLRGYSTAGIWSIWNTWYSVCESYSVGSFYVPYTESADEFSFSPYMHAYGFG